MVRLVKWLGLLFLKPKNEGGMGIEKHQTAEYWCYKQVCLDDCKQERQFVGQMDTLNVY